MDIRRIKDNVTIDSNGCWIWSKSLSSAGYGQLTEESKYWSAHRYIYTLTYGEIPLGLVVRHLCHESRCCNPEHLAAGSHKDNWMDSEEKHREGNRRKANDWFVGDRKYGSLRQAVKETGISMGSILKYSVEGVFDIDSYRKGCKIARVKPKV